MGRGALAMTWEGTTGQDVREAETEAGVAEGCRCGREGSTIEAVAATETIERRGAGGCG